MVQEGGVEVNVVVPVPFHFVSSLLSRSFFLRKEGDVLTR